MFTLQSFVSLLRVSLVQFQIEIVSCYFFFFFFFAPLLVSFSCVGGRDSVFVILHLSSPQSLRCCISIDFYTVLLQLCSKQCIVIL